MGRQFIFSVGPYSLKNITPQTLQFTWSKKCPVEQVCELGEMQEIFVGTKSIHNFAFELPFEARDM